MARKILGQTAPNATTETILYTVPGGKQTTVSSITICNRGGTETTFRISFSAAGGATANKDYVYYDLPVSQGDTFIATIGGTMAETDVIRVYAGNATLSFTAFGDES